MASSMDSNGVDRNRRRVLGALLGGSLLQSSSLRAQSVRAKARVAVLVTTTRVAARPYLEAFSRQLAALGWVEGSNLDLLIREGQGDATKYEPLAAELIGLKPDILFTPFQATALAAKKLTREIPVVFALAPDPVAAGLISSLARPGGNLTGPSMHDWGFGGKRLQLMRELVPSARAVGMIANTPKGQLDPATAVDLKRFETIAAGVELRLVMAWAPTADDMGAAIQELKRERVDLYYGQAGLYFQQMRTWVPLLNAARLPSVFVFDAYVEAGGLLWTGVRLAEYWRHSAVYVDRILRGAKPADLPIEAPTKIELVVNLKTARELGLKVPQSFLVRADQVIE